MPLSSSLIPSMTGLMRFFRKSTKSDRPDCRKRIRHGLAEDEILYLTNPKTQPAPQRETEEDLMNDPMAGLPI